MSDTVQAINILHATDNAAAVEERISQMFGEQLASPDWKRLGPNFIQNVSTGEVLNMNQWRWRPSNRRACGRMRWRWWRMTPGRKGPYSSLKEAVAAVGGNLITVAQKLQQVWMMRPKPWPRVCRSGVRCRDPRDRVLGFPPSQAIVRRPREVSLVPIPEREMLRSGRGMGFAYVPFTFPTAGVAARMKVSLNQTGFGIVDSLYDAYTLALRDENLAPYNPGAGR